MAESLAQLQLTVNRGKIRVNLGDGLHVEGTPDEIDTVCDDANYAERPNHRVLVALRDGLRELQLGFDDVVRDAALRTRINSGTTELPTQGRVNLP